jgi:hypothetical protein
MDFAEILRAGDPFEELVLLVDGLRRATPPVEDPRLEPLIALLHEVTHRTVRFTRDDTFFGLIVLDLPSDEFILEAAVHEFCHYVVASPSERLLSNLHLDDSPWSMVRELTACALEWLIAAHSNFDLDLETNPIIPGAQAQLDDLEADKFNYFVGRAWEAAWRFEREHPGALQRMTEILGTAPRE